MGPNDRSALRTRELRHKVRGNLVQRGRRRIQLDGSV